MLLKITRPGKITNLRGTLYFILDKTCSTMVSNMKQNKFVDGTHIFSKKMTHVTLTLNVTLTKQFHLYLVLKLCSLSTMTSMSLFMATLCSTDYYVKPLHIY